MKYCGIVIDDWCREVESDRAIHIMEWIAEKKISRENKIKIKDVVDFTMYESTTPRWMYGHTGD